MIDTLSSITSTKAALVAPARNWFKLHTLRSRVVFGMFLAMILTTLMLFGLTFTRRMTDLHETISEVGQKTQTTFEKQLLQDQEGLGKTLTGLARDDEALRLFVAGDREALLAREQPLFNELKTNYRITHLYFIQPSGEIFLRVHKPESFGDTIQRITFLQAQRSGQQSGGIEMGKNFFSLRLVRPITEQGTLIGYIEAGQEIDHILAETKQTSDQEISLWLRNDFIQQKEAVVPGPSIGAFTLLATTAMTETMPQLEQAGLSSLLEQGLAGFTADELQTGGSHWGVTISPFRDANGEVVGVLMTQAEMSAEYQALLWQGLTEVVLVVIIFLTLMGVLYWLTRRSFALLAQMLKAIQEVVAMDFQALTDAMEAVARGDLTGRLTLTAQPLTVTTQDEIGQIVVAFNSISGGLQQIGLAYEVMKRDWLGLIGQVTENAHSLSTASVQLSATAGQAGHATAQIATTIQQIAQGTAQQAAGVNEAAVSIEQMAHSIDGIAKGAQEQANAIGQTAQAVNSLTGSIQAITSGAEAQTQAVAQAKSVGLALEATVQQISSQTDQVAQFIQANLQVAVSGQQAARQAVSGMDQLGTATEQLAGRVRDLGKRSTQIGAIIETIDDIASQTNLLALNAAIEAARAGEHGKGFAVVADEVRKLAERSSQATREIREMIQMVQAGAESTVEAMNQAGSNVETGVVLTRQAGAAFETIATGTADSVQQIQATLMAIKDILTGSQQLAQAISAVEQVTAQNRTLASEMKRAAQAVGELVDQVSAIVEQNTAATEEMAAGSGEVTRVIDNIASISEENSAAVEEVSASAEEMSAQVHEVAVSVKTLTEMAQALQALVAQFKLADPTFTQPTLPQVVTAPAGRSHGWATPLAAVERNGYH